MASKEQIQLGIDRENKAIFIYFHKKGEITMKELAKEVGVNEHTASCYIKNYFKRKKIFQ